MIPLPRLVLVPDVNSWALGILSRDLKDAMPPDWEVDILTKRQIGSRMEYLKRNDIEYDVVYSWLWFFTRKMFNDFHDWFPDSKLMAGVTGYKKLGSNTWRVIMGSGKLDGVNTWCKIMHNYVKKWYPNTTFTRHGINHKLFKPSTPPPLPLKTGWCGNILHSKKNPQVLGKLNYPVIVHGRKVRLIQDWDNIEVWRMGIIPYEEMDEYYRQFHVYVCPSSGETGPLPVLEAASSGLPVISTRVGISPELLDEEWIIDELHDHDVIARKINKRLKCFEDNPELVEEVGKRNREEILKNWTWDVCIDKWVEFFES